MKKLYLIASLLLVSVHGFTQISTAYTFSQSSAVYTPITGGTVLTSGTTDDNTYGAQNIGFTFTYNNVNYTQFGLNVNGWISMGPGAPVSSYNPISTGTTNNIISGVGRDLQLGYSAPGNRITGNDTVTGILSTAGFTVGDVLTTATGFPAGTTILAIGPNSMKLSNVATSTGTGGTLTVAGDIRIETIGVAPNRICVIQWRNVRKYFATNDWFNYQIRLHETSNNVEVVYGSYALNTTSTTVEVGLRGNTNADFNNRTTTTNWLATTAGVANGNSCTMSNTVFPPSGTSFLWAPVVCSGTPTAGTITPTSTLVCENLTVGISAAGATSNTTQTGISYQWMVSSTPGGPYTNVVGGTGANTINYTSGALAAGTYYYVFQVTCVPATLDNISNEVEIVVDPAPIVLASPAADSMCLVGSSPIELTASGAVSYAWSPAAGLSATTGDTVDASPSTTTTYIVTGTGANGCMEDDTVVITVINNPVIVSVTATPGTICAGDSSQLAVSFPPPSSYCIPTLSSGCTFPDIISNVTLNTINRTSTCDNLSGSNGYSNIPVGTATTTLIAGNTYSISITTSGDVEGAGAWIDWNQNGAFDTGETILTPSLIGTNPATYNANFTVPMTALNGSTRFRARCTFSSTPTTACTGGSTSWGETEDYTITVTGGAEQNTFMWTPSASLNFDTISNPLATPMLSENYSVTVTDAFGCFSTGNVGVTVNPVPIVNLGVDTTLCGASGFTLDAGNLGFTYLWNDSSTNQTLNLTGTGTYFVEVTNPATGCPTTDSIDVLFALIPTITMPTEVFACANVTAVIDAGSGHASYSWNNGATTQIINPTVAGTYTVTVENADGCENSADVDFVILTIPSPVLGADTDICLDEIITLNPGAGFVDYLWNTIPSGGSYDGSTSSTLPLVGLAFTPGIYTYVATVTDNNGCQNSDTILVTVNGCSDIDENALTNLYLYPNPTSGIVTVVNPLGMATLTLYSASGQIIATETLTQKTTQVNFDAVPNGIYLVTLSSEQGVHKTRLVIAK